MRYKKPFTLYSRKIKGGKRVFYYRTYDENGRRTFGKSTGETNRARAEQYVADQIRKGELIPKKEMTFARYAEDWWVWDKCSYIRGKLARNQNLTRSYADHQRTFLKNHTLPAFGNKYLTRITPHDIENWILGMKDSGLSDSSIYTAYSGLRVMLREAVRRDLLYKNPAERVHPPSRNTSEKGIFTIDEVKMLLSEEALQIIWKDDIIHFTANLVAASCGCRVGEIQALRGGDIKDGYIIVAHSWSRRYGLQDTKNHKTRYVPVPDRTAKHLGELKKLMGEGFLFSIDGGKRPVNYTTIREHFYNALDAAGIPADERKKRNISLHSLRHWFNSTMRGRVPEVKLRAVVGHSSEKMSSLYTHFVLDDFKEIASIQGEYFGK